MSTISNERLEKLSSGNAWTCVQDDEAKAMATELLALRKEREKAGRPQSELSQRAQQILRDATALAEKLSAETDTTTQQFESLAGKAPDGWIPCGERMPDFYYSCLVADEHGDMVIGLPSNLEVSDRKAFCLSNGDLFLATHWQSLPEPPCK
ncbi:DUF551 domain-containing protein [Cronobacter malonaticus]|uniref:DUF551 domain-containing protein n=1 Tax=Cronobacter malonaticus TaxID=413503 RepID=UPI000CFD9501|nr:DUF551 domain-containing protein [Cronobacter malonaticus]